MTPRLSSRRKPKVLLIDDDELFCVLVQLLIEDLGCECDYSFCPLIGLEKLKRNHWDLVLLDLRMQNMSGEDWIKAARQMGFHPRIVVVTGSTDSEVINRLAGLGVTKVLEKPVDLSTLSTCLDDLIGEDNARRKLERIKRVSLGKLEDVARTVQGA